MKYHTKLGHIALAEIKLLFCDQIIIFSLFFIVVKVLKLLVKILINKIVLIN